MDFRESDSHQNPGFSTLYGPDNVLIDMAFIIALAKADVL